MAVAGVNFSGPMTLAARFAMKWPKGRVLTPAQQGSDSWHLYIGRYSNDRIAFRARPSHGNSTDEEVISVNVVDPSAITVAGGSVNGLDIEDDEFVLHHDADGDVVDAIVAAGLFRRTGKRVHYHHCAQPVYVYTPDGVDHLPAFDRTDDDWKNGEPDAV